MHFSVGLFALLVRVVVGISTITREGTGFIVDGKQFFIIGVDYQPGGSVVDSGSDPLSDLSNCQRDVYLMQQLGINTIRTYAVNHTLNHDACMSLFAAAGIYVVLDVNAAGNFMYSINIQEPYTSYNLGYMTNVLSVVEEFSGYPNLLGFIAGNELANIPAEAALTAPYIRAIQRDIRQYISLHVDREIPVGYAATDQLDIRSDLAYYLDCVSDDNGQSDFYGLNQYEWCGDATFNSSGYNKLVDVFTDLTMPIFFSEFGCNQVLPREFGDIPSLYSSNMTSVFSGGLVYEYNQEANNFGLVSIAGDGDANILPDYDVLQSRYAAVSLPMTPTYSNKTRPACSNITPGITGFAVTNTVPSQPTDVAALISNGVTNVAKGVLTNIDLNLQSVTWTITDVNGGIVASPTIATVDGWNSGVSTRSLSPPSSSSTSLTRSTTKPTSITSMPTTSPTAAATSSRTTTSAAGKKAVNPIAPIAVAAALLVFIQICIS